jgi:hypothetical protein
MNPLFIPSKVTAVVNVKVITAAANVMKYMKPILKRAVLNHPRKVELL